MILRALRLVHFRGIAEVRGAGFPEHGVVRVTLPAAAPPGTLVAALRFALVGEGTESPSGDGPGFTFVEVSFAHGDGETVSVFRGVDRRGTTQVSLRERRGRQVASGEADVAERLEEILGESAGSWCERALRPELVLPSDAGTPVRPAALDRSRAGVPDRRVPEPRVTAAGEESALAARRAVQELRRSLRAERLRLLASRRHSELLEHGRRLRHERAEVAREVDAASVERDRARTRLRRVNEYRDQLARGAPEEGAEAAEGARDVAVPREPPAPRRRIPWAEFSLVACAATSFMALVLYSTSASGDPDRRTIQIGLGVGFVVAVVSYLHIASRSAPTATQGVSSSVVPDDSRARRASLRRRFADLGDPDDPELSRTLRARLSELDARLSPSLSRLERLDDAITVFDVEAGRAARALHEALPELLAGEAGLPEGMDVGAAVALVHELGDAVYASVIEREALLAEGAVQPAEARQALGVALDAMTDRIGAPGAVAALLRRVDAFACAVGDSPEEDELADLLDNEIRAIESEPPVWASADGGDGHTGDGATSDGDALGGTAGAAVVLGAVPAGCDDATLLAHFGTRAQIIVPEVAAAPSGGGRMRRPHTSRRPRPSTE